ncbi:hypothetical protein EV424DRAFT_1471577 [Suillus variegatus]|nr:hypothetical protein EV424DRAFT_1471577 [Suillus variegatus]
MVMDFVSADYGWLHSSCSKESARILFHGGKSWDDYFTNDSILRHAELAMGILDQHYPHDYHPRKITFGVERPVRPVIGSDGKPVHDTDGKALTEKPKTNHCCCWHLLYNQPDFLNIKSNLELACEKRGYKVLFLPKFHCELNFIKKCWGFAKCLYQQLLPSLSEVVLKQNVIDSLDAVPIVSMQKQIFNCYMTLTFIGHQHY